MPTPIFSLIICTFNPDEIVFSRTLSSIENLIIPVGVEVECLIVDNNSKVSLQSIPYIQDFLASYTRAKVIFESSQGLTFARIKGIHSSTSPFLIFVDDDNELRPDYLEAAINHLNSYPHVGAWGPGRICVDFVHPAPNSFKDRFKYLLQEKSIDYIEYGNVPGKWMEFYPIGTGLILRREVAEKYCKAIAQGSLGSTDRQGNSLSSGGDIQLVWEAIKMGYSAGISPDLQLNHLIPSKRSNLKYIKRLVYGTSSSYLPALLQSFPEKRQMISGNKISSYKLLKRIIKAILIHSLKLDFIGLQVEISKALGEFAGYFDATGTEKPKWTYKLALALSLHS